MSALLKMKSDLTDLKFGADRPGYGYSGLPYIKTKLPEASTKMPGVVPIYAPGETNMLDYPIRGGIIQLESGQISYTPFSKQDKTRIGMFLKDPSRGTLFVQKQIGLQLSNPKIETGTATLFGFGQQFPNGGLLENTRVYNGGLNTLAQVGVSGTGAHAVRHGTVPFSLFQKNYYATVNQQNVLGDSQGSEQNRLVTLYSTKMGANQNESFVNPLNLGLDMNRVNKLGISLNKNVLFQYLGGPGSSYGIGSTTINRYVDTTNLFSQNPIVPEEYRNNYIKYGRVNTNGQPLPSNKINTGGNTEPPLGNRLLLLNTSKMLGDFDSYGNYISVFDIAGSPDQAIAENASLQKWGVSKNRNNLFFYQNGPGTITKGEDGKVTVDKSVTGIKRYVDTTQVKSSRAMMYSQLANQNLNKSVYEGIDSLENKGLTTAGRSRKIQDFRTGVQTETPMGTWTEENSVDYRFYVKNTHIDKLNTLFPFQFSNDKAPWEVEIDSYKSSDDLIKFVFEAVSNDNTSTSTAIFFRAFLNGTITDNNSATWNSFKYQGRGENFYTYQGFDRSISFSFRVYAASQGEIKPMYNRLNNLISQVYPDYTKNQGIMRGSIIRLTIGDYLVRMPGFLESVNLSVDPNNGWETLSDDLYAQLPHVVDVQVSFKPILETLPRRANSIYEENYMPSIIANNGKTISSRPTNEARVDISAQAGTAPLEDPIANLEELQATAQRQQDIASYIADRSYSVSTTIPERVNFSLPNFGQVGPPRG